MGDIATTTRPRYAPHTKSHHLLAQPLGSLVHGTTLVSCDQSPKSPALRPQP